MTVNSYCACCNTRAAWTGYAAPKGSWAQLVAFQRGVEGVLSCAQPYCKARCTAQYNFAHADRASSNWCVAYPHQSLWLYLRCLGPALLQEWRWLLGHLIIAPAALRLISPHPSSAFPCKPLSPLLSFRSDSRGAEKRPWPIARYFICATCYLN